MKTIRTWRIYWPSLFLYLCISVAVCLIFWVGESRPSRRESWPCSQGWRHGQVGCRLWIWYRLVFVTSPSWWFPFPVFDSHTELRDAKKAEVVWRVIYILILLVGGDIELSSSRFRRLGSHWYKRANSPSVYRQVHRYHIENCLLSDNEKKLGALDVKTKKSTRGQLVHLGSQRSVNYQTHQNSALCLWRETKSAGRWLFIFPHISIDCRTSRNIAVESTFGQESNRRFQGLFETLTWLFTAACSPSHIQASMLINTELSSRSL